MKKTAKDSLNPFTSKPRKKLGKNEKLFQQIFAKLAVDPSAKLGLLGDTQKLSIYGNGTYLATGGSSLGVNTCDCAKKGVLNYKCNRKFSDPDARRGWDSYHEKWYYGHCIYFLSVYNPNVRKDIPTYFRIVQAQFYDGITAILAI